MKKKFTFIAAALIVAAACNKEEITIPQQPVAAEIHQVRISLEAAMTKATNIVDANESKVNSVQIYVFNESGGLESYDKSANGNVTISVSTGKREFYALVNASDLEVSTKQALLAELTQLKENALDSFQMIGSTTEDIKSNTNVQINVKRIVAKVTVDKISRKFVSDSQGAVEMSIDAIYLTNVAGDTDYDVKASPVTWYNKMGYESSEADALLYDGGLGKAFANGSEYTEKHSFYPYPNPTSEDANGGTWSPRHTKLVIKTTYNGAVKYYPITLPVLQKNHTYTITELVLTRPGSDDEDIPVSSADCSFSIVVEDWETGISRVETI